MDNNKQLKTIPIPSRIISSMIEAQKKWEKFGDELEDFLLSSDKQFIKKMEKSREEDLKGKARNLQELKRELR